MTTPSTALVTGANSGIGFETAAQLAERGFARVILGCRTVEKAARARAELVARTGRDVFEPLAIDTSEPASAAAAADRLIAAGVRVDLLILNAGRGATEFLTNSGAVDLVYASTLVGHHALTVRLLNAGALSPSARVVIAGSEAARGDLGMGMTAPDFRAAAANHDGDLTAAMLAAARGHDQSDAYDGNRAYAAAKSMVAWWAAAFAARAPTGARVFAVSPGAVGTTSFARNMGFFVRVIMVPFMRVLGPLLGVSHSVKVGAGRYLDVAYDDTARNGGFYASPEKKMSGRLELQTTPHLVDRELRDAFWRAIVELSGGVELEQPATDTARASA